MSGADAGAKHPILHGLYLTVGSHPNEAGRLIAVCSDGSPQYGHDPVTVLSLESVASMKEAKKWFAKVRREHPWETRQ